MKKIIISVSNDIVTDQRVNKVATTLSESGVDIVIVGRKLKSSLPENSIRFNVKRFRLLFNKGFLFYATLNIRLFFFLLFSKFDLLVSNDLDTLLPNFIVAKIKGKTLVYDTHEYFTGVPEIQNRKFVKRTWKKLEKWMFPRLKNVYTVNDSIAELYQKQYKVDVKVIRNFSVRFYHNDIKTRKDLSLPKDKKIVILQGSGINIDRGGEEAIESMQYLEGILLLIIGSGDALSTLKNMTDDLGINDKVIFIPKQPYMDLMNYTINADLGLSLDKDTNINYRFSLPNKLFDYIQAEIPILASDLVEIKNIIKSYDIGSIVSNHDPSHIADKIKECLSNTDVYTKWKQNLQLAAQELCWENESKKLVEIYKELGLNFNQ